LAAKELAAALKRIKLISCR